MAQPRKPNELPLSPPPPPSVARSAESVLEDILGELRAIRRAAEQPRQTAERENAEFLAGLNKRSTETA
jgi:hypothetical protein